MGREALTALSGFTDLSSLRRDTALMNGFTVRYERVTIFPGIVFICGGRSPVRPQPCDCSILSIEAYQTTAITSNPTEHNIYI